VYTILVYICIKIFGMFRNISNTFYHSELREISAGILCWQFLHYLNSIWKYIHGCTNMQKLCSKLDAFGIIVLLFKRTHHCSKLYSCSLSQFNNRRSWYKALDVHYKCLDDRTIAIQEVWGFSSIDDIIANSVNLHL